MRERDRNLIAALAGGRLEDETEARALIESSEEARAEYEAQRAALDALSQVGPALMTEAEKAALHRDLWTQLRTEASPSRKGRAWFGRGAFVTAGLLLVIGVLAVVSQVNLGGSEQLALESADGAEEFATVTTAFAPAPSVAPQAPQADEESLTRAATALPDLDLLTEVAAQVRSGDLESGALDYDGRLKEGMSACLEEAGLTEHTPIGEVQGESRYVVAVPAGEEIGPDTPVFFVDADTCALIYVDE